jgi:hypothetical protein
VFESPRARFQESRIAAREMTTRFEPSAMNVFARIFFATAIIFTLTPDKARAESLEKTIDYLLDYVAKSDVTFVRNGQTHTPPQAVDHIKAKYEHFKKEIKTPEDFIRLSASKSLLTGQPYLVRTKDGKEMHLDAWLTDALKKHRGQ